VAEAEARLLLERSDVDVNSRDDIGRTPLMRVVLLTKKEVRKLSELTEESEAEHADESMVRLLLGRSDVEADSKDCGGSTPLSEAAAMGKEVIVKLLLERSDVEADSKDFCGSTPLSEAAAMGRDVIVKLLLERYAVEADSKGFMGRTPLFMELQWGKKL
jgi:ankyrin repeat protein